MTEELEDASLLVRLIGVAAELFRRAGWTAVVSLFWHGFLGLVSGVGGMGGLFMAASLVARQGLLEIPFAVGLGLAGCASLAWFLACVLAGSLGAFGLATHHTKVTPDDAFYDHRDLPLRLWPLLFVTVTFAAAGVLAAATGATRLDRHEPFLATGAALGLLLLAFLWRRGVLAFAAISRSPTLRTLGALTEATRLGAGKFRLPAAALLASALPVVAASSTGFAAIALPSPGREILAFVGPCVGLFAGVYLFGLVSVAAHVVASGESLARE